MSVPAAASPLTLRDTVAGPTASSVRPGAVPTTDPTDLVPKRPRRPPHVLRWIVLALVLGIIGVALVWHLQGGRWVRVETPSMGTVAPVGSLLWVKPVDFDTLAPGDIITFTPPGRHATYSHLVDVRHADGTIGTRGVLSGADSWRLGPADVVGKVVTSWPGVGWLVLMAPYLFGGLVLIALIQRLLPEYARVAAGLVLVSILLASLVSYYRPLVNAQQLAFKQVGQDSARVTFVGTGLLPVGIRPQDGSAGVTLSNGETGSLLLHGSRTTDDGGPRRQMVSADLKGVVPWWLWVGLVTLGFSPALLNAKRDRWLRENPVTT